MPAVIPDDLRISWSWPHFFVFIFFALSSFFLVQTVLILYFAPHRSLPPKELEGYLVIEYLMELAKLEAQRQLRQ